MTMTQGANDVTDNSARHAPGAAALQRTLSRLFVGIRLFLVLMLALYAVSGIFVVGPDEQAFVVRLGKVRGDTAGEQVFASGSWHWAFPRPIDEVVRFPADQARVVRSTNFWFDESAAALEDEHARMRRAPMVPGVAGYLVTGDYNIVHAKWSLHYRIVDPVLYYSRFRDPEMLIRNELDNAVLVAVAAANITTVLYHGAEQLRLAAQDRVRHRLAQLDVGVTVSNVTYDARQPPHAVAAAFGLAAEAGQNRRQKVDEARGHGDRLLRLTRGECSATIAEAKGYKQRIIASTEADASYFLKVLDEYDRSPESMLMTLHADAVDEVLERVGRVFVIHSDKSGKGQEIRLLLDSDGVRAEF